MRSTSRWRTSGAAAVAVLALATSACGGSSKQSGASRTSTTSSGRGYSLAQAQSNLPVGTSRFVFGLIDADHEPVTGGSPEVFVAKDPKSRALGPFAATWKAWSPPRGDTFGTAPTPGFFEAEVTVPEPGTWQVIARDVVRGKAITAGAAVAVVTTPVAAVGTKAISESTPVATTPEEAAKIDTRQPPTPMHYISLDAALQNGKPTVLVFATPQFCESRMCGPVVDEVLTVFEHVGPAKANFVDVEIYPSHDTNKPAPEFLRWGFESEPWVLVIDRDGIIRDRFEGPSVAPDIEASLGPLLN